MINMDLVISTEIKGAILEASAAVVAIITYAGRYIPHYYAPFVYVPCIAFFLYADELICRPYFAY